ncbi:MAG: peptidase S8, partial [Bacteroidetes bacterium]
VSPINLDYKLSPSLLNKNYPDWSLRGNNEMEVIISYYSTVSIEDINILATGFIKNIIQEDKIAKTQIARVSIDYLREIAALPYVSYVEAVYPVPQPENYTGKTLHRSNVLNSDYSNGRHYDGIGVNVMLQDDGIIGPHIDYEGRIGEQYLTYNIGDHGDHVAGTICGAGNRDPKTKGMAPGAELYVYGAAPDYPGFALIPTHYTSPGIRISSTSYSNGCNAGYTSLARTMDLQVRNYPSLMHVFSAGNSGTSNCGYGAGAGWGNVTGGHKIGKNVIAVANLNYQDILSGSSSRGPAHDGRIKPDISGKGSSVYSTTNPNTYTTKSGTSMSCPGVSGSLAQLYHAYKELNNGDDPKGGLIKAVVLNTADDLGNTGPDFKFGWGRINNLRAVETLEEYRYLTEEIDQGSGNTHTIDVPDNVGQLKIMLYWTDREASVGTNKALVNDLDLMVTTPGGNERFPWVLSSYPHSDSLDMPAKNGIDHLNNMEQVLINNPENDTYTILVDGFAVPFGPQEYYIVYEFVKNEIVITYPIGGESFDPGDGVVVRWDAFGNSGDFLLEYSDDNAQNWNTVNSTINGSNRYYNWSAPTNIGGNYLIRVSRNSLSGQSAEKFTVMHVPGGLNFDESCPNSAVISWEAVTGAESYEIYKLGEKYMELAGTTNETSIELDDIDAELEYWFSLKAIGAGNAISQRSNANMKSSGIWECEFNTDLAVSGLISPPSGILYDCQDYSDITVKVELTNVGIDDVQDVPIKLQFDGGTVINEIYNGVIEPGEVVVYEFNSSISLTTGNTSILKIWIDLDSDENSWNDVIESNMQLVESVFMTTNEVETFDDIESCGWANGCSSFTCDLDSRWLNLENLADDQIDWRSL